MTPSRRRVLRVGLTIAYCVAIIEIGCILLAAVVPGDIYYHPPTREEFTNYVKLMNDAPRDVRGLGWQGPREELTAGGYRQSPAGERRAGPCVSLYGDSFTFGAEVSATAAWGNRLAELLGCRVDNYGVVGYGTDQAVLRFLESQGDTSPFVILSHMAENIARNINQDRALIYGSGIALKPRFELTTNAIRHVVVPELQLSDYDTYRRDLTVFLRHEYFLPDATELSKRTLGFPYAITVPGIFTYRRLYSGIANIFFPVEPWYSDLYESGHPSGALELTGKIVELFARTASERGKTPLVFVLPTAREILYYRHRGEWIYQSLVSTVEAAGIPVYNLGEHLLAQLGDADAVCDLFCTRPAIKGGHYTEQGNVLLAEAAFRILSSRFSAQRRPDAPLRTQPSGHVDDGGTGWPRAGSDYPGTTADLREDW